MSSSTSLHLRCYRCHRSCLKKVDLLIDRVVSCHKQSAQSGLFFHRQWRFTEQQGKGGDPLLFQCTTSTRKRTLKQLFATFHVRWLSRIFNCNACVYQTAARWDLPPYRITNWLIDWLMMQCLFVYLMNWF